MKVIFLQDVQNVAEMGQVKEVANGYARNYLFPKKLAVLASPAELQRLESLQKANARRQTQMEKDAQSLARKIEGLTVTLKVRAGSNNRIYGSVTSVDIARELQQLTGQEIDKRNIELEGTIRELGSHQVKIKLYKNIFATANILVEQEQEVKEEQEEPKEEKKKRAPTKSKKKEDEKEQDAEEAKEPTAEQVTEEVAEKGQEVEVVEEPKAEKEEEYNTEAAQDQEEDKKEEE